MSDLALPEWHAHCGCWLTIGQDGEPVAFLKECEAHAEAGAEPADIAAENRAMSISRKAIAVATGIDIGEVVATITPAGSALATSPDGTLSAEVAPLTLDEYLGALDQTAQFVTTA